jgi:hypothetical protein
MPQKFTCSACNLTISIGPYHGFDESWITPLYCRHCGAQYQLWESPTQFFTFDKPAEHNDNTRSYRLRGPSGDQEIHVTEHAPTPILTCDICKTQGPFGSAGPITDNLPEGLDGTGLSFDLDDKKKSGKCPACKSDTMELTDEWTT